jgi:hypothetical protein
MKWLVRYEDAKNQGYDSAYVISRYGRDSSVYGTFLRSLSLSLCLSLSLSEFMFLDITSTCMYRMIRPHAES